MDENEKDEDDGDKKHSHDFNERNKFDLVLRGCPADVNGGKEDLDALGWLESKAPNPNPPGCAIDRLSNSRNKKQNK